MAKKALHVDRGTGVTSSQMLEAVKDSVFIWCNGNLIYPKRLAEKLDRKDISIVSPDWLLDRWRGLTFTGIVVDHSASLTNDQEYGLSGARMNVRR